MTPHDVIYSEIKEQKRPVIVAICGKSATGKDTLLNWLSSMLKIINIPVNVIVSDTTRPPRLNEEHGFNYNFLSENDFYNKIKSGEYLEYTCFNGWFYGTDKKAIKKDCINIGVFNYEGILKLSMLLDEFEILCVYLKCNLYHRLKRSFDREKYFKLEYLRRAKADYKNFKNIDKIIFKFPNNFIFDSHKISSVTIADHVIWRLKMKNLLPPYNKS